MKPKFNPFLRSAFLTAAVFGLGLTAHAVTYNWNTTTGTWDINTSANWSGAGTKWINSNDALFSNTAIASTITLDGAITAGAVKVGSGTNNANYKFTNGTGTLTAASFMVEGDPNNNPSTVGFPVTTFNNATINITGGLGVGKASLVISGTSTVTANQIGGGITGLTKSNWGYVTIQDTAFVTATTGVYGNAAAWGLNLNGGTLTTKSILTSCYNDPLNPTFAACLYFNGTEVIANTSNTSFVTLYGGGGTTAYVGAGGAIFNTPGAISIGIGVALADGSSAGARTDNGGTTISGTGTLTKKGTGTLTLTGGNTYTGATTLSNGTLSVATIGNGGVAGNLGQASNAATNIVFDGGTLTYTGNTATSDRAFTINAGKTATIEVSTSGQSLSLAGATGSATNGALTKTGAGTLTLTGANTYTGATSISTGTLVLSGENSGKTGSSTISAGATLQLQANAGNVVSSVSTALSSSSINKLGASGSGTSTLQLRSDSDVTFVGGNNMSGLGSMTMVFDVNQLTSGNTNKTIIFAPAGFDTYNTTINVTGGNGYTLALGSVNKGNSASLALNANSANLSIGAIGSTSPVTSLTVGGGFNTTITGAINISGTGTALTKTGAGTLTLSGASTYTGATSISGGGILSVSSLPTTGDTSSNLGLTSAIQIGGASSSGTLLYTGAAKTTDRGIFMSGGTQGSNVILDQSGTGLLKFTSNFSNVAAAIAKTLTLQGSTAGTGEISGAIQEGGNGMVTSLTKAGTGTWTLSGTNTYTGATTLSNGTLSVAAIGNGGVAGNLGQASNAASNIVFDGGTLQYTGSTATSDRAFTINTGKTATIEVSTSGQSLSLVGATGSATTGALTKTGAGTLTLTGANTYTGDTNVNAGKLVVNGSTASGSKVTVASGATLGGIGTISGATTISGILAPGDGGVGILNAGNTTWNGGDGSNSIWEFDLSATSSVSDTLAINGNFKMDSAAGSVYKFNFMNSAPTVWGNVYTLVTWTGTTDFTNANQFSWTGLGGAFDGLPGTGFKLNANSLTFTAVPEPTSALAGLLITAGLLRRRR